MASPSPLPDLLPLREKNLQCHNCNMRIFWSFSTDRWTHSESRGSSCHPGADQLVAHPRIR